MTSPYVEYIEGSGGFADLTSEALWVPTVYVGRPGPTRLHPWSAYTGQRTGHAERMYHALRIQEYLGRAAAIHWWRNAPGDLKDAVRVARSLVAGMFDDARDFRFMLRVQRTRAEDDPPFLAALATWSSGHIAERHPAGNPTRWGVNPSGSGRNLLGLILMRVAREHGLGPDTIEAPVLDKSKEVKFQ